MTEIQGPKERPTTDTKTNYPLWSSSDSKPSTLHPRKEGTSEERNRSSETVTTHRGTKVPETKKEETREIGLPILLEGLHRSETLGVVERSWIVRRKEMPKVKFSSRTLSSQSGKRRGKGGIKMTRFPDLRKDAD